MSDTEDTYEGGEGTDEQGGEEEMGEEEKMGEEEEEGVEEEEKIPDAPLTEEMIAENISLLCKTGDGLAHAYVKLDITGRELTNIALLKMFIHIRYLDISRNNLKDISPLNALSHLLTLRADNNLLTSVKLEGMSFLQHASFNSNKINSMEGISESDLPLLEQLSLNFNEISTVAGLEATNLPRLHTVEMRGNRLESTSGINLPNLKNLFLGANTIKSLEGIEQLESLTTLHLRDNQMDSLTGFSDTQKQLQYINLRGNNLSDIKEVGNLKALPLLRALVLSENPIAEEDDYRLEVLISLRKLERLDKDEYTEEERTEAEDIFEQRKAEEEANEEKPTEENEEKTEDNPGSDVEE